MGGCVNVFLRDTKGEFYKMTRWTNTLPAFLDCIGHVDDIDKHIADYMEAWLDMRDDWEENKKLKQFRNNMTPCYFPSPTKICNSEYGLVFVDFITKTILSYQDYSHVGRITTAGYNISLNDDNKELMQNIANTGCLTYRSHNGFQWDERKIKDKEDFLKTARKPININCYVIDNSPWTIEQGHKGAIKVKDLVTRINEILET